MTLSPTGAYAAVLAHAIPLPASEIELLSHAVPLHDVGKIGVPDAILLKQGPLTELAEKLAMSLTTGLGEAPHECLSHRELEVMNALASGKTATEIADELHLSVKTVSTYRSRILEKMNMRSTAEIIRYALETGLDL